MEVKATDLRRSVILLDQSLERLDMGSCLIGVALIHRGECVLGI
jgi:hypothetical protein